MATRLRKRPLVDRVRDLKRALETEQAVFKVHLKVCVRCSRAGEHLARRCDEGWQAAKVCHRLQLAVEAAELAADMHARQGTLW